MNLWKDELIQMMRMQEIISRPPFRRWLEMLGLKGTAPELRSENPIHSMVPTPQSSEHSSFNFSDRPRSFSQDDRKVNFAISYLKGLALAHFENALIEPDLLAAVTWPNNYSKFISKLKLYFGSPNIISEAKSRLQTLTMKPTSVLRNIWLTSPD